MHFSTHFNALYFRNERAEQLCFQLTLRMLDSCW